MLKETKDNIIIQAIKFIKTEDVNFHFTYDEIEEIASVAEELNRNDEV